MRYLILLIIMGMFSPISAQTIYKGKLDNGLHYYFAKTESKTVNFHLIQNIGAVVEQNHESGYVHFLEHMSFHASKNFPKGTDEFSKRNNITKGASTYKDKVIYSLNHINPDKVSVDSCISMLHDWGSFLMLKQEDIESEKKVVEEEWRSGKKQDKKGNEIIDLLYNHSPLAIGSTLGDMEIVKAATQDGLKKFYEKWFVPNLQAIYIEGNIDVKQYENKIKACYKDLENYNQTKKEDILIADNDEIYVETSNYGSKYSSLELVSRLDFFSYSDKYDFLKKKIYTQLYNLVMKVRLDNYHLKNRGYFQKHLIDYSEFHKGYALLAFNFTSHSGKEVECLKQIIGNHNSLCKLGLSGQEINLFSKDLISMLANEQNEKAYQIAENNFLKDFPLYDTEDIMEVCTKLEKGFDNNDFIKFCKNNLKLKNTLVVSMASPASNDIIVRDIADILQTEKEDGQTYSNQVVSFENNLTTNIPFEEKNLNNGVCHLKLKNGLEIYYRQTEDDSTIIKGFSPGGISAYDKGDIPLAESFPEIMNISNVGNYNLVDVELYKKRNEIQINFSIEEYFYKLNASCPNKNMESLYSLLFNKIENSHSDDFAFELFKEEKTFRASSVRKDRIKEEISTKVFGLNRRKVYFSSLYFDDINNEMINAELQKQYNNAGSWCYIIESNIPASEFKSKYLKYFSSIKNKGTKQTYTVHKKFQLKKDVRKVTYTGGGNGGIEYNIFLNRELSPKEILSLNILQFIVKNRCLKEFREKRSALYGMYTEVNNSFLPENIHSLYINLGIKNSDVVPFVDFVNTNIKAIRNKYVSEEEIEKAKQVFIKRDFDSVKNQLTVESYVANYLMGSDYMPTLPDTLMSEISTKDIIGIANIISKKGKKIEYLFK